MRTVGEKIRRLRGFYVNVAKAKGLRKQENGADAGREGQSQMMTVCSAENLDSIRQRCQEKNIIKKKKCLSLGHKILELEHDTVWGQGQRRAYLTHASPGPDSASVRGLSAAGDRNPNSKCPMEEHLSNAIIADLRRS